MKTPGDPGAHVKQTGRRGSARLLLLVPLAVADVVAIIADGGIPAILHGAGLQYPIHGFTSGWDRMEALGDLGGTIGGGHALLLGTTCQQHDQYEKAGNGPVRYGAQELHALAKGSRVHGGSQALYGFF